MTLNMFVGGDLKSSNYQINLFIKYRKFIFLNFSYLNLLQDKKKKKKIQIGLDFCIDLDWQYHLSLVLLFQYFYIFIFL